MMEDGWIPEGLGTVAHYYLETSKGFSHVQPTHWPEVRIPTRDTYCCSMVSGKTIAL